MFRPGKSTESLKDMGSLSTIKYVITEMIHNDPDTPVINAVKKGLFKGIKCEEAGDDQKVFILLESADGAIDILNTEYYNVLSVERSDGVSKYITFFQAHESDQDLGRDLLANTVVKLNEEDKTTAADSNIVDTKMYEDIPALFKAQDKGTSAGINRATNKKFHSPAATHDRFQHNRRHTVAIKPPEPKAIKRTGRRPNTKTIEKMRDRIMKLLDDDAEPYIPKLSEEEAIQVEKSSKSTNTVYDSDYHNCMCY